MGNDAPLLAKLGQHGERLALVDAATTLTYGTVLERARRFAARLLGDRTSLAGERVVFLVDPDHHYAVTLLGIWLSGAMAVPIRPGVPLPEIEYVIDDAQPACVVATGSLVGEVDGLAARRALTVVTADADLPAPSRPVPDVPVGAPALMLYTSGTTGRPKGVVHTHRSIAAQVTSLVDAWAWSADDAILLVLPLHHVHGIVNVLCCSLWSGARCEMAGPFDATKVWERFADGDLTLFMGVPSIYSRLISAWEQADAATRQRWSHGARQLRLMVSGSAALPVSTLERWQELTGHVLLERYGMTEIGMALSNTLDSRVPGSVGWPLPGVRVRVVDDEGNDVQTDGVPGELLVRGERLFTEYWRRPDVTAASFDDGWFRTGDIVSREGGRFRILGRASVDVIKTGGEKVSALEIEDVLREHHEILDCAVVGVEDPDWGERVCAAVVSRDGRPLHGPDLRRWGKQRLADYKVPRSFLTVPDLPRNAMGKVVKNEVAKLFQ